MPISIANRDIIKDLLMFPGPDLDALVAAEWEQQLTVLAREYDLFAYSALLDTVIGQSVYTLPFPTTRIYSVIFRGTALGYTDAGTMNLRDADWELALPDTPKFWSYNAIPPHADVPDAAVTYREFVLTPAPDGAQAGPATLRIYAQTTEPVPLWVDPILIYRTTAHIAAENPNLTQPEKGEFFNKLADVWLETARKQLQI